jgi:hypothetical protein
MILGKGRAHGLTPRRQSFCSRKFYGDGLAVEHLSDLPSIFFQSLNPLAPRRPISAAKKSLYIPRRPRSAACKTSFLDRSRHLLINFGTITAFPGARRSLVLNACGFYISWCTKFGQIFHLNLGARLAIHGTMDNGIL